MKTKLTGPNQHRLNIWLIAAFASNAELAERARGDLGFTVTECNIRSARKNVGTPRLYMQINRRGAK